MATEYKMSISSMLTAPSEDGLTDVVKMVSWLYTATDVEDDKTFTAQIAGDYAFDTPSEADFTPYNELTEDQVIGWIEAGMDMQALTAQIDQRISDQKNPPVVTLPLPWADPVI